MDPDAAVLASSSFVAADIPNRSSKKSRTKFPVDHNVQDKIKLQERSDLLHSSQRPASTSKSADSVYSRIYSLRNATEKEQSLKENHVAPLASSKVDQDTIKANKKILPSNSPHFNKLQRDAEPIILPSSGPHDQGITVNHESKVTKSASSTPNYNSIQKKRQQQQGSNFKPINNTSKFGAPSQSSKLEILRSEEPTESTSNTNEDGVYGNNDLEAPPKAREESIIVNSTSMIQTNDPDAAPPIQETQVDEADDEIRPKTFYGLLEGCVRDTHFKCTALYLLIIVYLILWIVRKTSYPDECKDSSGGGYTDEQGQYKQCPGWMLATNPFWSVVLFLFWYALFLIEFFMGSTFKYVRHMSTTEDVMDTMQRLYQTAPTLSIKIECYHFEDVPLLHHNPGDPWWETAKYILPACCGMCCCGQVQKSKKSKVVTHRETEKVNIVSWSDESDMVAISSLQEYQLTKVIINKEFNGDDDLDEQKDAMIERNKDRDKLYKFDFEYNIQGYEPRILSIVDMDRPPKLLNFPICLFAHLLLFPALPYRMYMSSITGKTTVTILKTIQTKYTPRKSLSVKQVSNNVLQSSNTSSTSVTPIRCSVRVLPRENPAPEQPPSADKNRDNQERSSKRRAQLASAAAVASGFLPTILTETANNMKFPATSSEV